jgi:spore cortex formation protein SpoVR/YcgB (stage V sporulation)
MAYREILTTGVQQLEDMFSNGRINLRVWLETLGLGANVVSGERRRRWNRCNPGVLGFSKYLADTLKFQTPEGWQANSTLGIHKY